MGESVSRSDLPTLSDSDVRAWVGDRSYGLGVDYSEAEAIFNARRQGMTLKADCEGKSAPSYRVSAVLGENGIGSADCSCPVGDGGRCKHVAALLLTWINSPEEFADVEETDQALGRLSREQLIALVKHMLSRHPDLELMLGAPLPTGTAAAESQQPSVDPAVYQRQARAAFRGIGREYECGASAAVAADLGPIVAVGAGFLEQGSHANAAAVYEAVVETVLENYDEANDEEGDLVGVVQECSDGLRECLAGLREGDPARDAIVRTLFDVYQADMEHGGIDLGDGVPETLIAQTTKAERETVARWVREALPTGAEWSDSWRREGYGGLLLGLEAEDLDDASYIRVCRETGRVHDLVDRLLALGRLEEAEQEARQAGDYDLLTLADVFGQHGQTAMVEKLIVERAPESKDSRLTAWLKQRHLERGDFAGALDAARDLFRRAPSLEGYQGVRDLARQTGRWDTLRPTLLDVLSRAQPGVLIEVYLDEGEVGHAIEMVRAAWQGKLRLAYDPVGSMELTVARAAEESQPRDAIEIYRRHVDRVIEGRNRPAYRDAVQLLQRVRALYERLGEQQLWQSYLWDVRSRTRTLPAFKAELQAAGL